MVIFTTPASSVHTYILFNDIPMRHTSLIAPLKAKGIIFLYLPRSGPLKKISALTAAALKTRERSVSHLTAA